MNEGGSREKGGRGQRKEVGRGRRRKRDRSVSIPLITPQHSTHILRTPAHTYSAHQHTHTQHTRTPHTDILHTHTQHTHTPHRYHSVCHSVCLCGNHCRPLTPCTQPIQTAPLSYVLQISVRQNLQTQKLFLPPRR